MKTSSRWLQCMGMAIVVGWAWQAILADEVRIAAESPRRPNILMIVTDDQAEWSLGCAGNRDSRTPQLDRMAQEGLRLPNAFVATPVCSPSRLAIMTGRYASEFGITDWIDPNREPDLGIPVGTVTWPQLLAQAGYRTGLVGKWHLGTREDYHPLQFGYQHFNGFRGGGVATKNPILELDGQSAQRSGLAVDLVTDLALRFLEQSDDRPWCLSVHYREPHAAYLPVADHIWREFESKPVAISDYPELDVPLVTRRMREYLASVAAIDEQFGRLLATLEQMGQRDNTIVIYTSDHGYNLGHHGLEFKGNAQWRLKHRPQQAWDDIGGEQRPNLFDTSLRVPLLIRWPGHIAEGAVREATTINLDWFPTICELAGVSLEANVQAQLRGVSLVPMLLGTTQLERHADELAQDRTLYFEYSMHHGARADMQSIRTSRWKWIRDTRHMGRVELYDLLQDPGETTNLADSSNALHRTTRQGLDGKLDTYFERLEGVTAHSP